MLWLTEIVNGRYTLEERERIEQWARQQRAETFHRLLSAAGRGLVRGAVAAGRGAWSGARGLAAAVARQHRRRAAIRELSGLSDYALRDIGLSRGDIRAVVDGMLEGRQTPQTDFRVYEPRQARKPAEETPFVESPETANDWQRAA
jgi:uncharacterized protein YjiS (DUF1127 family)